MSQPMSKYDGRKTVKTTHLFLPGADYTVQCWKVKFGSIVRIGETVAIAMRNEGGIEQKSSKSPVPQTQAPTTQQHKRPKKRRRNLAATAAAAALGVPPASTNLSPLRNPGSPIKDKTLKQCAVDSSQNSGSVKSLTEKFSLRCNNNISRNATEDESTHIVVGPKRKQNNNLLSAVAAKGSANGNPSTPSTVQILAPADGWLYSGVGDPSTINDGVHPSKKQLAIGYIEECSHPGFMEGLCVVCGISILGKNNTESQNSALITSSGDRSSDAPQDQRQQRVTVSGGVTMTVSQSEGQHMAQQSSRRLWKQRKLSLVLDLDHTLVHATSDNRAKQFVEYNSDVRTLILPLMEGATTGMRCLAPNQHLPHNNMWMQHYVKLRPHIKEFLEGVQPFYEVSVYTAGTRQYAEEITIVLCRHMVGAYRDHVDLEQLRYRVQMAETEFKRHLQSLDSHDKSHGGDKEKGDKEVNGNQAGGIDNMGDNKSRQHSESKNKQAPSIDIGGGKDEKEGLHQHRKAMENEAVERGDHEFDSMREKVECGNNTGDSKRKKKVSFVPSMDKFYDVGQSISRKNGESESFTAHSGSMTEEGLENLRKELLEAERLEAEGRDLRQRLFGSRVVSRSDVGDLGRDVKSLKRIFPCGGTMAAVVDDREDVWANATDNSDATAKGEPPDNLLLVRPYHWAPFLGFADVNNAAGVDLSGGAPSGRQVGADKESDVQLLWTGKILKELHERYYAQTDDDRRTVPEVLSQMRREVLHGFTLVLSGLVPLHKKNIGMNAPRPPVVRYAEGLGSKILDRVQRGVTHVVAAKDGTDKAIAARKTPGCLLVKASWLLECFWSLTRRDVEPHLLGRGGPDKTVGVRVANKEDNADNSGNSSSDDDDLAAEFEEEMMDTKI